MAVSSLSVGALTGGVTYVFCRNAGVPQPFEKTVFATVLAVIQFFTFKVIDESNLNDLQKHVLKNVCLGLAIPCTLLICRLFNVKISDYLHCVGLTTISIAILHFITSCLTIITSTGEAPQPLQEAADGNV